MGGALTHFPYNPSLYMVIDQDNFKKNFTAFNTGLNPIWEALAGRATFSSVISLDATQNILLTQKGLLYFSNPGTDPALFKWVYNFDLPGYNDGYLNTLTGFAWFPSNENWPLLTDYYYYTDWRSLYKINDKMDSLIERYPFPGKSRITSSSIIQNITNTMTEGFWITTNQDASLLNFLPDTEEWIVYDSTNLPISWNAGDYADDWWEDNVDYHAYIPVGNFRDFNTTTTNPGPMPMIPIVSYYKKGSNYFTDNALLYYNRITKEFDTLRIDLTESVNFKNDANYYVIKAAYPIREM